MMISFNHPLRFRVEVTNFSNYLEILVFSTTLIVFEYVVIVTNQRFVRKMQFFHKVKQQMKIARDVFYTEKWISMIQKMKRM